LAASASAKAKLVNPLVARWAPLSVFYFPGMLAVHLVVGVDLLRHTLIILRLFLAFGHQLKLAIAYY
jgi:hypothetical protein